ncbi:MAG: HNH endonuclease [Candidatus Hodarchaeales archaeon]
MPVKRPCTYSRCPNYAIDGSSKCVEHHKEAQKKRFQAIKKDPIIQKMYNTSDWQQLRFQHKRKHPFCVICGARGTDVDHKVKHNGDPVLFYNELNLQTLCKRCHGAKTLRGE